MKYSASNWMWRTGVYTGNTVGTLTYREGKITRLLEWLDAEEENLEGASFYSDSRNDLPLLLKVDLPQVVNPDPVLREHAEKAGWPIHHLEMTRPPTAVACQPFRRRGVYRSNRVDTFIADGQARPSTGIGQAQAFVNHQHHLPFHLVARQFRKRRLPHP